MIKREAPSAPVRPLSKPSRLRAILSRVGLFVVAWLVGSAVFGVVADLVFSPIHSTEISQRLVNGYEAFGVWCVYRIGARLFRFRAPRGPMLMLNRLTWCFFAYSLVGGSVEVAVGHPTLAAGVSGIPLAVVLYLLLTRIRTKEN